MNNLVLSSPALYGPRVGCGTKKVDCKEIVFSDCD